MSRQRKIENYVHYVLDVTMRKNKFRVCREFASENIASLKHFVVNLVHLHPQKGSMKRKIQDAGWDDSFRKELLFTMLRNTLPKTSKLIKGLPDNRHVQFCL